MLTAEWKVAHMVPPEDLKSEAYQLWWRGRGIDVWAMLCSSITGDLETIKDLVARDPNLIDCASLNTSNPFGLRFVKTIGLLSISYLDTVPIRPSKRATRSSQLPVIASRSRVLRLKGARCMQRLVEGTTKS